MSEDPLVVSISSQVGLHPDEIIRRTFPAARRGVDGDAVRRFLESVAEELRQAHEREAALRRRLSEAERRAADPEIDEHTLSRAVGMETAKILQTAHEAASEVVAKAEATAGEILASAADVLGERTAAAEAEAEEILRAAEDRAAALEEGVANDAAALRDAAAADAEELTTSAHAEAVALLDSTRQECRRMVREARELRHSVLGDLADRRRDLRVQLEQLRTGRDSLLDVVDAVGDSVDQIKDRLVNAEHEARLAAAEAGDRAAAADDESDLFPAGIPDDDMALDDQLVGPELAEEERAAALDDEVPAAAHDVEEVALESGDAGVITTASDDADEALALAVDEALATEFVEDSDQGTSHRSVDALFARIRASRRGGGEIAAAPDVVPDVAPDGAGDAATAATEPEAGVLAGHSSHEAAIAEVEAPDLSSAVAGEPEASTTDDEAEPAAIDEDAAVLARRTELLAPVTVKLARALKRALQDDQNLLLDAIRHGSGQPDLAALSPADAQQARIHSSATTSLAEAFSLGHGWLTGGEAAPEAGAASRAAVELATEMAQEIAALLRHRLEEALSAAGDSGEGAIESASATYREWRGQRIEGAAGDFATRAFAWGAVAGGRGIEVRWIADDDGQPCPDCDDNALAGVLPAGEAFPTGQLHPPVHPGCRCLLVPATP